MIELEIDKRDIEKRKILLQEISCLKQELLEIQEKIANKRRSIKKIEQKFYDKIQGKLF
jgi:hypothetical protein